MLIIEEKNKYVFKVRNVKLEKNFKKNLKLYSFI